MPEDARPAWLETTSSDGRRVLEAELAEETPDAWIARAREHGAELLWLHTNADLSAAGFERFPGYVRLRAENVSTGEPLPRLSRDDLDATLEAAFRGLWGHHRLSDAEVWPPPEAVVLGLYEAERPVGLCTIFPAGRLIDGPGVEARARDVGRYARLLSGACAELGPGSAELESWGDDPAVISAYEALGFAAVERVTGWQLRLE
jgi:hypothetical protein